MLVRGNVSTEKSRRIVGESSSVRSNMARSNIKDCSSWVVHPYFVGRTAVRLPFECPPEILRIMLGHIENWGSQSKQQRGAERMPLGSLHARLGWMDAARWGSERMDAALWAGTMNHPAAPGPISPATRHPLGFEDFLTAKVSAPGACRSSVRGTAPRVTNLPQISKFT